MQHRVFGPTGIEVPVIGQGTWMMERDPEGSIEALVRGLDLGMNHIDTAEMYGSGRVEEVVGKAIDGRREEVFLVSKVLPKNATKEGTVTACESSLKRLGTDHLDVYLLHSPSPHRLEETIGGFMRLKEEGKILHYGVSNFSVALMQEAVDIAGESVVVCNQVSYHLKDRGIEEELVGWCGSHDVALVGYSPFGQGDFPGRNRVLKKVADRHGSTTRQVALAFLTRFPHSFAIPKSSKIAHVEDNAGAAELVLTQEDIEELDAAFDRSAAT